MHACDDCPGSEKCAGQNLHPILVHIFDLYSAGTTNKFDLLFALGEEMEALLERFDPQLSRDCWTKAALLAIVEVAARDEGKQDDPDAHLTAVLTTARNAFAQFPWRLDVLVEQAPNLYTLIQERSADGDGLGAVSKRSFVKICKTVAYDG